MYPLHFLKKTTAVQNFQITQRQAEGLLDFLCSTNLLVGSVHLPSWLVHLGWSAACHVSANPLVGSGPLPDWPARLFCPCPN